MADTQNSETMNIANKSYKSPLARMTGDGRKLKLQNLDGQAPWKPLNTDLELQSSFFDRKNSVQQEPIRKSNLFF